MSDAESPLPSSSTQHPSPPKIASFDPRHAPPPAYALFRGDHGGGEDEVLDEVKKQMKLAGPLVAVSLLQYSLQLISIMFVGHLGELSLAGASMATSFASVTGYYVLLGMASALETLCGQAYGAKKYHMLGVYTQRAMITLIIISIPISFVWYYTSSILILLHQDHEISIVAGKFNKWMIPSLLSYAILQCHTKFLQTQKNVIPMMACSGVTATLHVLVCWLLVFKSGLGTNGAALANTISSYVNMFLVAIYIKYSSSCKETWNGFSKEAFCDLYNFVKLAVSSGIMICLEYWSFEMVVLLSGLLKNPKLQTSVLSISLSTCWMVYMISVGLGGAISTRVSNELGAGNAREALLALRVMIVVAISQGLIIGVVTILVRNVWGKLYSSEEEVIAYVSKMMPLLALSNFLDGFQCVLSGAARGCGWQNICVCINLGAYYLLAVPSAVVFAFVLHMKGQGLWLGIICGLVIQVVSLITLNLLTNWDKLARKAVESAQTSGAAVDTDL